MRFDSSDFLATLSLTSTLDDEGLARTLTTSSRTADHAPVRSLYYRRPSGPRAPRLNEQTTRFAVTQVSYGRGGMIASLLGCPECNGCGARPLG
ncbi:hypothetical protein [Streptomyces sp. NPDC017941]|uniref:hypothetical protein n=1 Tax=Streptomyces sp. NPDC017941 TaxID=3365018 RepID=UPI0037949FCD